MTPARRIASYLPPSNRTLLSRLAGSFDRPDADPLGLRRVLTQAARDLFGTKDVQDAITASYVWLADQIGHLTLGLVPTLLLSWIWRGLWLRYLCRGCAAGDGWLIAGYLVIAAIIFAFWVSKERTDYRDTKERAGKVFFFDSADIVWNIKTALLYFAIGGVLALASFVDWPLLVIALALVLWPALRVAFWWLRRKLAFQQAGLPYLYRLANFAGEIPLAATNAVIGIANLENRRILLGRVCFGRDVIERNTPAPRHIVLTGPLGAGKTSLAVGIGTEFAFALGIGRYLSAAKLVQLVADRAAPADVMDYDDGRVLWPWQQCELLIVDDVDAGAATTTGAPLRLVEPKDLEAAVDAAGGAPLAQFGERRSVWVVGDPTAAPEWRQAIARLLRINDDEVMIVELKHPLPS